VSALVPHRWTLTLQGVMCLTVVALTATYAHTPFALIYIIHLAVIAITSWGCFGEMVADRPGPERLPEFLFFTGLAPSVVFSCVPTVIELLTPQVAYPGIVLLAFLARFLPGKYAPPNQSARTEERGHVVRLGNEMQPVIDTSIRVVE
jgi:hypothetical protein